jgi:hypothetical protein
MATATSLQAGRKVLVQYADDLPFWHARVLLHPAPLEIAMKVLGSVDKGETEHWWVLT